MAGPFARSRRGEGAPPEPDAPTETVDPATAEAQASPTPHAPSADGVTPGAGVVGDSGADAGSALAADGATPLSGDGAEDGATADGATTAAAAPAADVLPGEPTPGFVQRGRLRRRLRFVRRAREVALRDLGGLVFDLHRFGRERTDLVDQKLATLSTLDGEMRTLEGVLDERGEGTVLREPGLASCPRCGALHASDAAYCSACGLPVGRGASLPTGPALAGPLGQLAPGSGGADAAPAPADPTGAQPGPSSADRGASTPGTNGPAHGDAEPVEALTAQHRPAGDAAADEQPTTTP